MCMYVCSLSIVVNMSLESQSVRHEHEHDCKECLAMTTAVGTYGLQHQNASAIGQSSVQPYVKTTSFASSNRGNAAIMMSCRC